MLHHFPFEEAKGQLPYGIEADIYQTTLFQSYAEAFVKNDGTQIANKIMLLELALEKLPHEPAYYLERAFLLKACGDAYLTASSILTNGSTLKLTPFKEVDFSDARLKQEQNLTSAELTALANEKFNKGILFINELKATPIASPDGKTIYGIPKEEAIALEKYFRQKLNLPIEEKSNYQLVNPRTKQAPNNSFYSYAKSYLTYNNAKTAGKYLLYAGGAAVTIFVARNLDTKKCSEAILSKGDEWCRFLMSHTPLKGYMAVAPIVVAPIISDAVTPANKK